MGRWALLCSRWLLTALLKTGLDNRLNGLDWSKLDSFDDKPHTGISLSSSSMQATVGLLVAKTLSNATANPFLAGGTGSYNPVVALDVFLVQARPCRQNHAACFSNLQQHDASRDKIASPVLPIACLSSWSGPTVRF